MTTPVADRAALVQEIALWLRHVDRLDEIPGAKAGLPVANPLWDASFAIERKFAREYSDSLEKAADAAYAAFYPTTIERTARGLSAWKGEPDRNPLLRPLRKALEVLNSSTGASADC